MTTATDPRALAIHAVKRLAIDDRDADLLIEALGLDDPTIDFQPEKGSAPLPTNDPRTGARESGDPTRLARNVKGMTTPPGLANLGPLEEPAEAPAPAPAPKRNTSTTKTHYKKRPPREPVIPDCGTMAAYARHRRLGVPAAQIDDACIQAERTYNKAKKAEKRLKDRRDAAFARHIAAGVEPVEARRRADLTE